MKDKSLNQQLDDLVILGNKNDLHDAADWVRAQIESARLLFNLERERAEQISYLGRFKGDRFALPELRSRLQKSFPGLTIPKAHAIAGKWLREHGSVDTVKGVLVS